MACKARKTDVEVSPKQPELVCKIWAQLQSSRHFRPRLSKALLLLYVNLIGKPGALSTNLHVTLKEPLASSAKYTLATDPVCIQSRIPVCLRLV